MVGNVNLASNRDYNLDAIMRICMGMIKVLLLLNDHGDPSFLFENLSSYKYKQSIGKVSQKSQCRSYFSGMTLKMLDLAPSEIYTRVFHLW